MCIVDRIYNQPLGGLEAKESTSLLTDINSIEFHRQYYRHKVKEMYEGFLKVVTGDKAVCPEKLYLNDFFYTLTISFFAEDLLGIKKKVDGQRIGFFKRVLEDVNAFDHIFLSNTLPEDRTQMHFLVWGKVN